MFRRCSSGFVTAFNKRGRALGWSSNSIVMKGWGISCASSSSSSSSVGVFLSLVLSEASASGWWPEIAPSAGTLAQFTTLRSQPGAGSRRGARLGKQPNPTSGRGARTCRTAAIARLETLLRTCARVIRQAVTRTLGCCCRVPTHRSLSRRFAGPRQNRRGRFQLQLLTSRSHQRGALPHTHPHKHTHRR